MMADTLHNLLYKFMDQYANVYDEVNTNQNYKHPFAEIIRKSIPNELKQQLDTSIYQIRAVAELGDGQKFPGLASLIRALLKAHRQAFILSIY